MSVIIHCKKYTVLLIELFDCSNASFWVSFEQLIVCEAKEVPFHFGRHFNLNLICVCHSKVWKCNC